VFDDHRNIIPTVVSLGSSKFSAQVLALHTVLDLLEEIWWLEKTRYLHAFPAYNYAALPGTVESLMSLGTPWRENPVYLHLVPHLFIMFA